MTLSSGRSKAALLPALILSAVWPVEAQAPEPSPHLPVSIDRVREGLARHPGQRLRLDVVQAPVVVFRAAVDREYLPSFEELLEKEFTLNDLQRQSQDWSARCCGLDLLRVAKSVNGFLKRREARKVREQVARELAWVEAPAKK